MEGTGTCQVCQEKTSSRCTNCRKAWYCSREHQRKDWKRGHKSFCYPWVIAHDPVLGRHLTSTRDILEGELLLQEQPLFSAPNGKEGSLLLCLVCYAPLDDGVGGESSSTPVKCSCHWPLHAKCMATAAATPTPHSAAECEIFKNRGIRPSSKEANVYDKILALRGSLLKLQDPGKWSLILSLQASRSERNATEEGRKLSRAMIDFVLQRCGLSPHLTSEEVDHVVGVIVINAYVSEDNLSSSPDFKSGSFVYWSGSMPAHSCLPNCKWTIGPGGLLSLRSLHKIPQGSSLTHCYTWGGSGTAERRSHLLKSKYFICGCERCSDPTELGSYFSAIKCGKCSGGWITGSGSEKSWNCGGACNATLSPQDVEHLVQSARDRYAAISSCTPSTTLNQEEVIVQLEELRASLLLHSSFHPNHFLIHEVEQDILLRLSYVLSSQQQQQQQQQSYAERMVELSRKSLSLMEKISPGSTSHNGRQLYYLQQGLGIHLLHRMETSNGDDAALLKQEIWEWKETRRKGSENLKTESKGREEYVLALAMEDNNQ